MRKVVVWCSTLMLTLLSAAVAYDTIEVKNGGTIEGVVLYTGATIPKDPLIALTSETAYCGKSIPAKKYLINDRKVQNAIVYINGITAGKELPGEAVTMTNLNCEFVPRIAVGFKGNKFIMKNDDPVLHTFDIHTSLEGRELYHVGLHEKGSSVTKTFPGTGLLEVSCYIHPWQFAYVYIFDHPYAAVTDKAGRFVIRDIPPGTYTVEAWHEKLGTAEIENVEVKVGTKRSLTMKYTGAITVQ